MLIIKKLVKEIKEELHGAESYIKLALEYQDKDEDMADVFCKIAEQEMVHVSMLHGLVTKVIEKHKKEGKEVPVAMQAVWDYEHENMMEESKEIKMMIAMYKE